MSIILNDQLIAGGGSGGGGDSGASRNIGEVFFSTIPVTDAGVHLLDGSLINGSGSYSDFVDYIADLVSTYPDCFTTESDWQTSVNTYGVCGKFVYDNVANTVRLPKYSSKIYTGGGTAPVIGNGITLGLTNGTYNFGLAQAASTYTISATYAYDKQVSSTLASSETAKAGMFGVTEDASKSGLIADLANITTSLDGYYYIVIATSTKTNIQVDIDEIATDLNGKVDKSSLVNLPSDWCLPSNTYIDLTLGASGTSYTAPADGYYTIYRPTSTTADITLSLTNATAKLGSVSVRGVQSSSQMLFIPAKKNDEVKLSYSGTMTDSAFRFVYAVGSESEANQ